MIENTINNYKQILLVSVVLFFCLYSNLANAQVLKSSVSNDNELLIHLDDIRPMYTEKEENKFTIRDYYEFTDYSKSGEIKLPVFHLLIPIPEGSSPQIKNIKFNETAMRNTILSINPSINKTSDSTLQVNEISKVISPPQNHTLVEMGKTYHYRNLTLLEIDVFSVKWDYTSNTLYEYNNIEFTISFSNLVEGLQQISNLINNNNGFLFKNVEANLKSYKSKRIINDTLSSWINYDLTYTKIGIANDGLYRINKSDLEQLGFNTTLINPQTFQLFNFGKEIPIYVFGADNGVFDDSDYIEFIGTKNYSIQDYRASNSVNEEYHEFLNRYTDTSYYFLSWGGQNGKRINIETQTQLSSLDSINYYSFLDHHELNTMYQNLDGDEVANQKPNWLNNKSWYWQWIFAQNINYNFTINDLYPNQTVRFYSKYVSGSSNISNNAHNIVMRYSGVVLDSQVVDRFKQVVLKGSLNSNTMSNGTKSLNVQNYANGTTVNYLALDWYDIEYPRQLKLINDSLLFKLDDSISPGIKVIKIDNAQSTEYLIYKIKPEVKRIENYQVTSGTITFVDSILGGESYIVIKKDKTLKPKYYGIKQFKNLRSTSLKGEYVAITHPKFWNEAQEYVNEIGSLYSVSTKLVNVEDIFDEFGFGYPDPHGIRLFCQSAYANWQAPKPLYLVLIGDADYDYKQYRYKNDGVTGGGNYVPSFGNPVSDNWFAVWDENALPIPELMVGRIPINSGTELQYYLNKVKNNFNSTYDSWNKRYLFFSGGRANYPDEIQQLKGVNDRIISTLITPPNISGYYNHFYKTSSPQTDFGPHTPAEIQKAISKGGLFISYIGHSGTATWDNSINEVTQLKNNVNRYPLITDFGCSTNKFAEPDIVCFGERFVVGENGQALGYVGNSSLGFTSSAYAVPQYFYETLLKDSAKNIGETHLVAKIKMFNLMGSSDVFKVFALTNSLLGDPIVSLKIPPKPNLKINPADIKYSASALNDATDSLEIRIVVSNLGLAILDSFAVSIEHLYKNTLLETQTILIPKLEQEDTLITWLRIKGLSGEHSLSIILDSGNIITEIYEDDNRAEINFTVVSNALRDNLTSVVENSFANDLLLLSPGTSNIKNFDIKYQLSQTSNFASYTENTIHGDTSYTRLSLSTLLPNMRYWLRYKIDNEAAQYGMTKSFMNIKSEKYFISDSTSFANQKNEGVNFQNSTLHLSNDSINISVLSAGWYAGASCLISKNGTNLLSNTFFAGMGIAVFNEKTLETDTTDWYQLFGNPTAVQKLADFINAIPNGKIVAIGVADDARNNLSTNLKNAIKTLGSTLIDQLQFRGSWAIIGKKGGAAGTAIEMVKSPYDGNIIIDTLMSPLRKNGTLTLSNIGPSNQWKFIKINYENNEDSKIVARIDGFSEKNRKDSLMVVELQDAVIDLSNIHASNYPFIQIHIEEVASTNGISPKVSSIGVDFSAAPELATNYQVVFVSRDSVIQGDSLDLHFYVYNVGESPADSFHVLVDVMKEDNSSRQLLDSVVTSLDSMQRKAFNLTYKTNGFDGKGNMGFKIKIDPDNHVREFYEDNNEFTIPFYTKPDTNITSVSASTVAVTFDNVEILNGDFVSNNPKINIDLNYPTWFAVSDTSALSIMLDNQKVSFDQLNIKNDSANRLLTFNFIPTLANGEHLFNIYGNNVYGKLDNQPGFERLFTVSNELAILNCYNYPNPAKDNTYFTFKLPRLPEELTIRVYTIAGRLVKEIKKSSAELNLDFNRIFWDTKDEDGNYLANGVYLYKMIVKQNGKTESITQKLAIVK